MSNILMLKTFIKNGWTIANRRAVTSQIGKENFDKIAKMAKETGLVSDVFEYQRASKYLSFESIKETFETLINQMQKENCLLESKTFSKLFSKEFQPMRKMTEEGFPVTTIIEKETGKPIEVYFKKSPSKTVKRFLDKEKVDIPLEEWTMYRKLPNGEEEKLGFINWTIEKDKFGSGFIGEETEYLKQYLGKLSEDVKSLYSGIGVRLNQLKIERFLQENLGHLEICSSGTAFPFHAKNGFRAVYKERTMTIPKYNELIRIIENRLSELDSDTINSVIEKNIISKDKNNITLTSKFIDELCSLSYLKTGERRFGDIDMELPKEGMNFWKNLIGIQPILSF